MKMPNHTSTAHGQYWISLIDPNVAFKTIGMQAVDNLLL